MKRMPLVILSLLLLFLLIWRFQVGTTRFFDADEFSYLHWVAQVARGDRQYIDFYSYFTPGFMWAFAPIFWMYGVSSHVLMVGRIVSYGIFLGVLGGVGVLWGITRGWKWAILPVLLMAFLPMPYDKLLEIRPDTLATLFAVIGICCEVRALQLHKPHWWLLSGLVYSASLFVLVKTMPIVAVGVGIALFVLANRQQYKKFLLFSSGLVVPWILFFSAYAISGHFHEVWYSLTKLVFEAAHSAPDYLYMIPTLFFYPNSAFYGGTGQSLTIGLLVNHSLWIAAILFGAYRLVTAFYKKQPFVEILIALSFFVSIIAYMKFYPLKHSQYLIPISVFVAYYAAEGLSIVYNWFEKVGGITSLIIILLGFVYLVTVITIDINKPKLLNSNTAQITELSRLIVTVPFSARVVDLEGKMFFWKEGYPTCCIPFDLGLPFETEGPPPLAQYLDQSPADYIYDGGGDRLQLLSPTNRAYIRAHYVPVLGWGERLWKRLP